ncbi:cardiolipin synthase [Aliibacillus thermotolerans]|uniref:Cardiolipin synthase n=1 Tax=Aliibacillus thermotolerans TaxID=1834418 RepID=A0ABW0U5J0_9BACI|nr:cardiolipin synthase [Aliibacillus thermotolerans]MDA3129404.1 cardiolipin synthase [Aliibacillus thermotolerans]
MTFYLIIGVFVIPFFLFIWCKLDFMLGKKRHNHEREHIFYPRRKGHITFFRDGKTFFDAYFEDIKNAQHHIHIHFFIFRDDQLGSQLIRLLCNKAENGVHVNVMADRLGAGMSRKGRRTLKKSGVQFTYSQKVSLPFLFFSLNRRNHRKMTIIDGKIGYVGGFNVGDEYIGRNPELGFWRDFHLRIEGQGVTDIQTQFLSDWMKAKQTPFPKDDEYFPTIAEEGKDTYQILASDGSGLETFFTQAIEQAKKYLYIASPYFVPSNRIQKSILQAIDQGVDVHIILPEKRDHPFVKEASYAFLEQLMSKGASVYYFREGFFHAKALLIDEKCCDVGTANMDMRSFFLNNEMNVLLFSSDLIQEVKNTLDKDIEKSLRVKKEDLQNKSFWANAREQIALRIKELL